MFGLRSREVEALEQESKRDRRDLALLVGTIIVLPTTLYLLSDYLPQVNTPARQEPSYDQVYKVPPQ